VIGFVPVALAAVGLGLAVAGVAPLRRRQGDRALGSLEAIDAGRARTLRSVRYRLAGRPDALRRAPDGSLVPVELKHRPAPRRSPYRSHRIQLLAYCLLVEEETGRAPPFGVLRYRDRDVRLRWDRAARAELLSVLSEATAPYDGGADPSPGKCAGCRWAPGCDASLA
jgi:CRISPR-associated exonuclease Cas4